MVRDLMWLVTNVALAGCSDASYYIKQKVKNGENILNKKADSKIIAIVSAYQEKITRLHNQSKNNESKKIAMIGEMKTIMSLAGKYREKKKCVGRLKKKH